MLSAGALLVSLRIVGAQDLFIPARQLRGPENATTEDSEFLADAYPDMSTGLDVAGPYTQEPHEGEAETPRPTIQGWENSTFMEGASNHTWGQSFCTVHGSGYFCDNTTRVRCCQQSSGFVKCGTTLRSSACGWTGNGNHLSAYSGAAWYGGGWGGWHIHRGWRRSSFCQSHHVGWFCYSHHKVHCCNDYGHFVECTTSSQSSWRC